MNLNSIHLHDAELKEIKYDWNTFSLAILMMIFLDGPGKPSNECILMFTECSYLEIPHKAPWGDSLYVNGAIFKQNESEEEGEYEIEMISGDIIRFKAKTFELITT